NVLDLLLPEERVVDEKDRASGIAEDEFHALFLEAADDDLGAGELGAGLREGRQAQFHAKALYIVSFRGELRTVSVGGALVKPECPGNPRDARTARGKRFAT